MTGPAVNLGNAAELTACQDPNASPVANAGGNRTIVDTDGQSGENVLLDGSASTDPDPGTELTYLWSDVDNDTTFAPASTSPTLPVNLGPGVHNLQLTVQDDSGNSFQSFGFVDFVITVNAPAVLIANAGPDRDIADSDGQPGESVVLERRRLERPRRHDRFVRVVPRARRRADRTSRWARARRSRPRCPMARTTSS